MTDHMKYIMRHGAGNSGDPKDIVSYEVTLKSKRQIATGTFAFVFERPVGFEYRAGQHGRITLIDPPETDAEGNSRFLSFASAPDEADLTFAMRMRDTAFKRVMGGMKVGEKVLMQMRTGNIHGSFALQDATEASRPAVFLIGGIGIVPVFSMIKGAIADKLARPIYLFYSNRRPKDAPFLHELESLAKRATTFKLIATMTQPEKSAKPWKGETGMITQDMIQSYVDDLQAPIYYITGMTEMVRAMQAILKDAGVNNASIRAEEFGAFAMAHEKSSAANPKQRSHLLLLGIALLTIAMVALHIVGVVSLSHTGAGFFTVGNPAAYLVIGLLIALAMLKYKRVTRFRHGKKH